MSSPTTTKSNFPHAAKLMTALRHLDYSNLKAVCDIIDNSIDADASQIWINISSPDGKSIKGIEVIDNGRGMDETTLDEALKLGSDTDKNPDFDLGLYGMGLVTASISMGKVLEVTTKQIEASALSSTQNIDEIVEKNEFIKSLDVLSKNESDAFVKKLVELQKKNPKIDHSGKEIEPREHGTIVTISNLDELEYNTRNGLEGHLITSIGQVFRKFIQSERVSFYVNKTEVIAIDPIADFEPTILCRDSIAFPEGSIDIVIAELKNYGKSINRDKKINITNQGFYLLRNNREIAAGETLNVFATHNDFNTLRIEFSYPATLDSQLNSNFSKQRILLPQNVKDKVEQLCNPFIKQVRNHAKARQVVKNGGAEDFSEIEKFITRKSHLLKTPEAELEKRDKKDGKTEKPTRPNSEHGERLNITKRKRVTLDNSKVSFRKRELGAKGPIFEPEMEKNVTVIFWNIQHPFYQDFIAPNSERPKIFNPIAFLVYSLATAELRSTVDSDSAEIIDNIRWAVGSNLAILLK